MLLHLSLSRSQKILTTESQCCWTTALSVTPGYEVTQCSNVLWFSLCFDCCSNKYSGAMRAKSPCYYYNRISNGRVQQRQAVTIFAKVFPFQKYVRECNKETLIVVLVTYRDGDNPYPMIHHYESGWWWEVSDIEYETLCLENTNRGNNSKKVSVCTL